MRTKKLSGRLFVSYLFITILSLLAALLFASWALRNFYYQEIASVLEKRARLVETLIRERLEQGGLELDRLCRDTGLGPSTRITVIAETGEVLCDTDRAPAGMDNHGDRPEIRTALRGQIGTSIRYSHTTRKNMLYVAVPLQPGGNLSGVVRVSLPLTSMSDALRRVQGETLLGGLGIALVAALVSLIVSRRITRPLVEMKRGAELFAAGALQYRLPVDETEELGGLAQAMNAMASELDSKIQALTRQRSEQEAILSSMTEGLLAVSGEERILIINQAAGRMLGVNPDQVKDKTVPEALRNRELLDLLKKILSGRGPVEGELELAAGEGQKIFLQVHAGLLLDSRQEKIGAVIAMNDVTRLRRLEEVRKEFVANVSHELRTPITSIKGFVETLQEGAIERREDALRFLAIIARQVDQMNAIIEDLLLLSRVEREEESESIAREEVRLKELIEGALEVCAVKAESKKIRLDLECDPELTVRANSALLSQALVNLIDNAVAYSEPGQAVEVKAKLEDARLRIRVKDQGAGIPAEHLPRIFERFYRVDKARSRKLGGTGLGLAIVKHIVRAHHGQVTVESEPGKGSVFTISLPRNGL